MVFCVVFIVPTLKYFIFSVNIPEGYFQVAEAGVCLSAGSFNDFLPIPIEAMPLLVAV